MVPCWRGNRVLVLEDELEKARAKVAELSAQYGVKVDPSAYVWQLSIGEQQRVEILKILYRGADSSSVRLLRLMSQ